MHFKQEDFMAVKIGHASLDEHGNIRGGAAGDQTGREVYIRDYYTFGYNVVIRAFDPNVAENTAKAVEAICKNDNVGYNQSQRNTLRKQAVNTHFNIDAIKVTCNCDCSSMIAVALEAAGVNMAGVYSGANAPTTSTMRKKLLATGEFEGLTDKMYLTSSDYLKRGDILVKEGSHTVCVLSDGAKASKNNSTSNTTNTSNTNTKNELKLGDAVTVNGNIYSTAKGTGNRIRKNHAKMYVVGLLNKKMYSHYIGVGSSKNGARQGWASLEVIGLTATKPIETENKNYFKKTTYNGSSIIDGLKSIGVDSSFAYRKKIALANGIASYSGTGSQNKALVDLLKSGKLVAP